MMRTRLRPTPTPDELAQLYATPHDHQQFSDHVYRVDVTSVLAHHMMRYGGTVADLSCGNGLIARRLQASHNAQLFLGDYAPGYQYTGAIEDTIQRIPRVDLFICSETIEHLDDPDAVLTAIRGKTEQLLLSTPDGEDNDENPEHIWGWDAEAVEKMLRAAGFTPDVHTTVDLRPAGCVYSFQIWACR
jgi:2-polyprenyl-3-methyl-5-hydroxy-6-metoxy-1,4-benzoquinol methylase